VGRKIVAIIGFPSEKAMLKWMQKQENLDELEKKYPGCEAEPDPIEHQIVIRSMDDQENGASSE